MSQTSGIFTIDSSSHDIIFLISIFEFSGEESKIYLHDKVYSNKYGYRKRKLCKPKAALSVCHLLRTSSEPERA